MLSTIEINKRIIKYSAIKCAIYKNRHLFQECPLSDFLQSWFWQYWFWWCTKSVVGHLMNSPLQHGKSSRTQRGTQLCQLLKWKKKRKKKKLLPSWKIMIYWSWIKSHQICCQTAEDLHCLCSLLIFPNSSHAASVDLFFPLQWFLNTEPYPPLQSAIKRTFKTFKPKQSLVNSNYPWNIKTNLPLNVSSLLLFFVRGGRDAAPSSCGLQATAGAAETTAPATATPTPYTPSLSRAQLRVDASRGTWRSARPHWPPLTAAGRTMTERL